MSSSWDPAEESVCGRVPDRRTDSEHCEAVKVWSFHRDGDFAAE